FSALVNNPEFVQKEAPDLYNAFEQSVARNPKLNDFWSEGQKAQIDPDYISKLNWSISREARERGGDIEGQARLNKIKTNSVPSRVYKALDLAYRTVFDREAII